jgi:DNA-binding MarR family transcriptional regulator
MIIASETKKRGPGSAENTRWRDAASSPDGLDVAHLRRLAEFRYQLRRFLHVSQAAAEQMGLRNQQYQLLQCVGGMPEGIAPTIANVAARMLLKHNSAVELVDRTIDQGFLRRLDDAADRRKILLKVTPHGERMLASLAVFHTRELKTAGPQLVQALNRVLRASESDDEREKAAAKVRKAGAR